jgi:hypothetical protein
MHPIGCSGGAPDWTLSACTKPICETPGEVAEWLKALAC